MKLAIAMLLLAACDRGGRCAPASLAPSPEVPAYAVVVSDYSSSAIALLDARGELLDEAWMDSATFAPRLVAALSGDVSLPTAPIDPCRMAVIDRLGTDVISVLDFCTADPDRVLAAQIDAQSGAGGAAFRANPQDVLRMGDSLYATRLEPGIDAAVGDDLLRVDAASLEVIGRVDLSALDRREGELFYARPVRMAALDDTHFAVGLALLTLDFMRATDGAVALVDAETQGASSIAIDGLANCTDVVPTGDGRAIVACQGDPFATGGARRARAGLALLELAGGELRVAASWRAIDHPDAPIAATFPVALGGSRVAAVAMGDRTTGQNDVVVAIDLATGDLETLLTADDAFAIGSGAFDPQSQVILLPDASRSLVRRIRLSGGELDPVDVSPCRGLPPREIRPVR